MRTLRVECRLVPAKKELAKKEIKAEKAGPGSV